MACDMRKTIRSKTKYVATVMLATLGITFVLVVQRATAPLTVNKEALPVAVHEENINESEKYVINSIPEHPPFRYNMTSTNVMYPWKDDKECSGFAVRLGVALPPVFLISFPRSGNTWTRYLLQGATGFFTGSVYDVEAIFVLGFPGEYEDHKAGTTLFIKDHLFSGSPFDAKKNPVLLIIRNPKNAIESYVSYHASKKSMSYKGSEGDFKILDKRFDWYLDFWKSVTTRPLMNSKNLHVVVYENLKANPIEEIRKIMKFVRMPEDPARLACLAKHLEGNANRGQPEFEPFNAEQTAKMAAAVELVNALMLKRGFPPLPFAEQRSTSGSKD